MMQPKDANTSDIGVAGPLTASAFSSALEVIREQMLDACLWNASTDVLPSQPLASSPLCVWGKLKIGGSLFVKKE